jgi:histidyl-tRNA synthetase
MNSGTTTTPTVSAAPARGMRDMLPEETAIRDWATAILVKTYEQFGFTRIDTPAVENIANLRQGEGGENLKLIFEVLKRGEKLDKTLGEASIKRDELADLGLRFDLTVPLVRFYANNQAKLPNPFKSIQIGSVWRAESPQQGRYRQFTQCDIDTFGIKSEIAEMELIEATAEALLALGFEKFTVRLNDRRILMSLAEHCGFASDRFENLFIQIDKLDKIGVSGVEKELLAQGHEAKAVEKLVVFLNKACENKSGEMSAGAAAAAKQMGDPQGAAHKHDADTTKSNLPAFKTSALKAAGSGVHLLPANIEATVASQLRNVLTAINKIANGRYTIEFDPTLVRGMGYYTGQIFEIVCPGYSSSVAGGGRYDKMVGKMIGRDVPACGFSIGFERIISILMEKNAKPKDRREKIALIFDPDKDDLPGALAAAQHFRGKEGAQVLHPNNDDMPGVLTASNKAKIVSLQPRKKEMRKQLDALMADGYTGFAVFKGNLSDLEIKPLEKASSDPK